MTANRNRTIVVTGATGKQGGAAFRHLKQRGVPVAGADRIRLLDQIAIMDLVALGRFALLPEDDLNTAALLRSPLLGCSEDALYAITTPREGTLWRALAARCEATPATKFAHEFLRECRARADFAPPYEYFAHVLGPRGGRKRLRGANRDNEDLFHSGIFRGDSVADDRPADRLRK